LVPRRDVDILGQARPQHTLVAIDTALHDEGFGLIGPDLDGYAHRYRRDGLIVDVLAPDGIKPPARVERKWPCISRVVPGDG